MTCFTSRPGALNGTFGRKRTAEECEKISKNTKLAMQNPEVRAKLKRKKGH